MSNTTATLFASRNAAEPYLKHLGEQGMRAEDIMVIEPDDLTGYGRGENLGRQQEAGYYQTLNTLAGAGSGDGRDVADFLVLWGIDRSDAVHLRRAIETGQTLVVVRSSSSEML